MSDAVEDYNLPLHLGGLFANMAASSLGVLLPILFAYTTFNARTTSRVQSVIQTARTFGSGVILATAFIHMLPSAFANLSDPSLPEIFQEDGYSGWAGLIAMTSALLLHLLEFSATQRSFSRAKKLQEQRALRQQMIGDTYPSDEKKRTGERDSLEDGRGHAVEDPTQASLQGEDSCHHVGHVHGGEILLANKKSKTQHQHHHQHQDMSHALADSPNGTIIREDEDELEKERQERRSREIGTYILELGIALHSVIIGITLGTTVGAEFVSLLIALLFHQFFEGVALGGRIASINFSRKSLSPWLLSAWFAISTPLGIAIGIGIRATYDGTSVVALIVQGVFDSCSAGILLYTALVQLMSAEINTNKAFREASFKHKAIQFGALWLGAASMAVLGKWA
ncbi:high-affinity Zn(2+) transporter zrt1 [Dissophora globulifera]|nr:high-affinity Zn(2+) transporter zrt1 [Dissophora globulifera]